MFGAGSLTARSAPTARYSFAASTDSFRVRGCARAPLVPSRCEGSPADARQHRRTRKESVWFSQLDSRGWQLLVADS